MGWIQTLAPSIKTAGAVAAKRFVGFTGAQVSTLGGKAIGVALMNAPVAGQSIPFLALGIGEVESGAAVAIGDDIISDSTGRAITSTNTAGHFVQGVATTATTAAGQTLEYLAMPPVKI
jgi:hypothetical protein